MSNNPETKPKGRLRALALRLLPSAALLLAGLASHAPLGAQSAQDVMVAIFEPDGEARNYKVAARNAFIEAVSAATGFQVIDRLKTDRVLKELGFQRESGLISNEKEIRAAGEQLGVDVIFVSEVEEHPDSVEVSCQAIDVTSGRIVASKSEIVEGATTKQFREACLRMVGEMLKVINKNKTGKAGSAASVLPGLDSELLRMITNNKSNAKWNRSKDSYKVTVDLAGVKIAQNRSYDTPMSIVSGTIQVTLTDTTTDESSETEVELDKFSEMGDDRIRDKIKKQVQPKLNEIIRELLSGLGE
jgi:TolB-like protein